MSYNKLRLDRERILKGWTRRHLGELSGVSEQMVGQVLNKGIGTPRTVKKIVDALGLTMSEILIDDSSFTDRQKASRTLKTVALSR